MEITSPSASFPDARSSLTELITYQNTSTTLYFAMPCPPPPLRPPPPLSPNVLRDPETPRSRHGPLSAPGHACHPACLPWQHPHRCHVRQPPLRRLSLPLFPLVVLIPSAGDLLHRRGWPHPSFPPRPPSGRKQRIFHHDTFTMEQSVGTSSCHRPHLV